MEETLVHPFPPLYDRDSRVLILGSFPSVRSREQRFFYGHPQNRFWKVIAAVTGREVPGSIEEKKELLHASHIALWDSIGSCRITASSDASIRDVVPNDIRPILEGSRIRTIFTNGSKSHEMYEKYILSPAGIADIRLPSTSPANAAYSLEKLIAEWAVVGERLRE